MTQWLAIEQAGLVEVERIVAVGRADSAPMQRLIQQTPPAMIVTLTGGRKRQSVLVLDSGHLVITAVCVDELWPLLSNGHSRRGEANERNV